MRARSKDPALGHCLWSLQASLLGEFEHPKPLSSASQGNFQALPNGDWFAGWGAAPYFSEFSPSGQLLFDAHMHGTYQSYRGYRFPWGDEEPTPARANLDGFALERRVFMPHGQRCWLYRYVGLFLPPCLLKGGATKWRSRRATRNFN